MSQAARWVALACVAIATAAAPGGARAADPAPAPVSPDTALPPLSPPIDVPMHVPQPPRDVEAPPPRTSAAPAPQAPIPQAQVAPAPVAPQAVPARPAPVVRRQPVETAQAPGGTITPIAPRCRETAYRVIIDGRPETAIARLCPMADGRWRLVP